MEIWLVIPGILIISCVTLSNFYNKEDLSLLFCKTEGLDELSKDISNVSLPNEIVTYIIISSLATWKVLMCKQGYRLQDICSMAHIHGI